MELITSWAQAISGATGLQPWAMNVFLVVLAAMLIDLFQRRLMRKLGQVVAETTNNWDDAVFNAAVRPLTLVIWMLGITIAAGMLPVFDGGGELDGELVASVRQTGILCALAWFVTRFVKNVENNIVERSRIGESKADQTTVRALGRVLRITVVVTASLVVLDTLGFNIAGLMAAGGIGGLAVGLAAKDLLANFFGGVTVFIDRPFSIGDWVLLKGQGIEGTVEDIGWRQTVIRKFDKRPVYVPNAIFTTASVETPSRMTHRRIYETIGLRYGDIASVQAITDQVREMLQEHKEIDHSQTLMVHFNAFSESTLDFFVYCMTHTVNWQHYHAVKQDVLLRIAEIIERNGASIAFPTRTLNLKTEPQLAGLAPAGTAEEPSE
jgi:MscS family membrane protein